jgi:hypothetical protein
MADKQDFGAFSGALEAGAKINPYGLDQERLEELRKAQQDAIERLQKRYEEPNWFKVAAGFAKPQLGGFLASLGSAAEAMGENVEQQRAQELPIAQLKLQMYQTQMIMGQNKKAADMVEARKKAGLPMTPEFAAEVARIAPDSPVAKALATEIGTQQKEQELAAQRIQTARALGIDPNPADIAFLQRSSAPGSPPRPEGGAPGAGNVPGGSPAAPGAPAGPAGAAPAAPEPAAPAAPAGGAPAAPAKAAGTVSPTDFLNATHGLEGTAPGKTAPNSTATGPGGLLKSTQETLQRKYNLPSGYGTDPAVTAQYENALIQEHSDALKKNGLDNNVLNHRMMWWFGSGDMPKLMQADPSAKIGDILSQDVLKANGLNPKVTVGRLISRVEGNLWDQGLNPRHSLGVGEAAAPAAFQMPVDPKNAPKASFENWGFATVPKNATYNEYTRKQWEEKEKAANKRLEKVAEIGDPESVSQTTGRQNIKTLLDFAGESKENRAAIARVINNLGKNKALVNALLSAGEEGFHATFNGTSASVGLPVKKFLDNLNDPEDQKVAQMVMLAIDNANFVNAKLRGMSPTANIPAAEANIIAAGMLSRDLSLPTLLHSFSQLQNNLDMYGNLYKGSQNLYNRYNNQLSPLAANYQIVNSDWWNNTINNHTNISNGYLRDYTQGLSRPRKKKED